MISQGLPKDPLMLVTTKFLTVCEDDIAWAEFLKSLGIEKPMHIRIVTEGALIGSLINTFAKFKNGLKLLKSQNITY